MCKGDDSQMTLRELVQQAGGINSPAMDYELCAANPEKWLQTIFEHMTTVDEGNRLVRFELSHEQLAFLERFEI